MRAVSLSATRGGNAEAGRLALRLLTWPACVGAERCQDERRGVDMRLDELRWVKTRWTGSRKSVGTGLRWFGQEEWEMVAQETGAAAEKIIDADYSSKSTTSFHEIVLEEKKEAVRVRWRAILQSWGEELRNAEWGFCEAGAQLLCSHKAHARIWIDKKKEISSLKKTLRATTPTIPPNSSAHFWLFSYRNQNVAVCVELLWVYWDLDDAKTRVLSVDLIASAAPYGRKILSIIKSLTMSHSMIHRYLFWYGAFKISYLPISVQMMRAQYIRHTVN